MHAVRPLLTKTDFPSLRRAPLRTLQVNLGYLCNMTCVHCHVAAGPNRTERMSRATAETVLAFLECHPEIELLDLTGGAPEMNAHFSLLVTESRRLGRRVMDRCNLTILEAPAYEGLGQFLADNKVEIVASLPCYSEGNVDKQRGKGTYESSVAALQRLNGLGYAHPDSGLLLHLVYNPLGPSLPPGQRKLKQDYQQRLWDEHRIRFNELFVITNMPVGRFGSILVSKGQMDDYLKLLKNAYEPANLANVMCRTLISVDWQGYVYDCDFNQMLDLPLDSSAKGRAHLRDLMAADLTGRAITTGQHCYGCTAGQGSSCGGALTDEHPSTPDSVALTA